ncbi:MAG: hypothetical protein HW384_1123 [Dehalococcoidia bacterium]|nr:hypothetical protein [Dehalococcoidia bacterium]MBF8303754.1 hypothetical protein [Dehalococcoidia bacterium]
MDFGTALVLVILGAVIVAVYVVAAGVISAFLGRKE